MGTAMAVMAGVTALLVAITGLILSIVKIGELKIHINSRMDQMLEMQKEMSHAEGVKDERQDANQRGQIQSQDNERRQEGTTCF